MSTFSFGRRSTAKLETCHPYLRHIAQRALGYGVLDFAVIWGWRNEQQQNALLDQIPPATKTPWPQSKHNHTDPSGHPQSLALDFGPWIDGGIPWADTHAFAVVAGLFMAAAAESTHRVRWGGDWDRDGLTTDQTFMDYGHIELVLP